MGDIEKLKELLEMAGWKFSKQPFETGVDWYAYRPLRNAVDCARQGEPPVLMIEPYDVERLIKVYQGNHHFNGSAPEVEFTVFGDLPSGRAVKFKEYGVKARDVMEALDAVEYTLSTSWSAAASADAVRAK